MKETELCARERVDVAMGRCLVILEVNFMIKLAMRGHVLSLFSREHIEKVLVGLRDDFGEELCLVSRKGLRVQSGHWSGLVADGLQGHCNTLKRNLQRRVVENWPVFERSLLPRWFLSSRDDREALFTESRHAIGKTVNPHADKTCSDNFGRYVLFRWM